MINIYMRRKKVNVYFYPYKNAKDIIFAFFHKQVSNKQTKNALNTKVTFQDPTTKTKKMTIAKAIKVINKLGAWGFCMTKNSKEKSIHYWFKNKKNIKLISNLFAHEYAHVLYGNSETIACQCGTATAYAIKFLLEEKLLKI